MEYETKKTQILSNVEYSNLLQFSLVENKLERNFRTIVEALQLSQEKTQALYDDHIIVRDRHDEDIQFLKSQIKQLNLKLQINVQKEQKQPIQVNVEKATNIDLDVDIDRWGLWEADKNNFLLEINNLKQKVGLIGYFEGQIDILKKDIMSLKGQFASLNTRSVKSVKRQSIMSIKKPSQKVVPSQKMAPSQKVVNVAWQQNKQNNLDVQIKAPIIQNNFSNDENQKQFNSIYIDLNTLKLSFEELKDMISDCKKNTYKHSFGITQLKDGLAKQIKDRIVEDQNLEKMIKQLQMDLLNFSPQQTVDIKVVSSTPEKQDNVNVNFKNQLNDKISRLQAMIQNFVTENQFNRFKNQTRDSIQKLDKKDEQIARNLSDQVKRLQGLLGDKNLQIEKLNYGLQGLSDQVTNNYSQCQRKNNICLSKIEELKKSLQNLREDMEFYQSMADEKKNAPVIIQSKESKEEPKRSSSNLNDKNLDDLKKFFAGKIQDLRTNLIGMIRDVEKKLNNRSSVDQQIIKIWDKINELNLFLNKKADSDDTKKSFVYLEKKINRLSGYLMKAEDNTDDARIARTNQWNCLSCDKNLQTYQGKIGRHIVWDSMPLKGISKNVEIKKSLPQLKR